MGFGDGHPLHTSFKEDLENPPQFSNFLVHFVFVAGFWLWLWALVFFVFVFWLGGHPFQFLLSAVLLSALVGFCFSLFFFGSPTS